MAEGAISSNEISATDVDNGVADDEIVAVVDDNGGRLLIDQASIYLSGGSKHEAPDIAGKMPRVRLTILL